MGIPYKRRYREKKVVSLSLLMIVKKIEFPDGSERSLPEISPQVST